MGGLWKDGIGVVGVGERCGVAYIRPRGGDIWRLIDRRTEGRTGWKRTESVGRMARVKAACLSIR